MVHAYNLGLQLKSSTADGVLHRSAIANVKVNDSVLVRMLYVYQI